MDKREIEEERRMDKWEKEEERRMDKWEGGHNSSS
jgi:hypothetical protein